MTERETLERARVYISLSLNKRDIKRGIDYLNCISMNDRPAANEGLFISALAMFANRFANSTSRCSLDKNGF